MIIIRQNLICYKSMTLSPLWLFSIFTFIFVVMYHTEYFVECIPRKNVVTVSPRRGIASSKPKGCYNKTKRGDIFYIKTQKTASTTLKSSLLNYGMKMDLQICMDSLDLHHLNFPYRIDPVRLTKPYFSKCELIADELVFSEKAVKLMNDNALVLTSVRHPVPHFISLFKFARIQHAVQLLTLERTDLWDSIKIFLRHRKLVQNIYATYKQGDVNAQIINLLRPNLQLFSLGLHSNTSEQLIRKQIGKIDFIFISERFRESMVLLASKLCCRFDDLVFVKQNVQRKLKEELDGIPEEIRSLILDYNKGDSILYQIAVTRFENLINNEYGASSLLEDVQRYGDILELYRRECKLKPPLTKDRRENYCLQTTETGFYDLVREKQKSKLLQSLQNKYEWSSRNS